MNYIYALVHPESLEIKYIGKTTNLKQRLGFHVRDNSKTHKANWIKSLRKLNLFPGLIVLEEVESNWQQREMYYIKYYRDLGVKLCNGTDGGDGSKGNTNTKTKSVTCYSLTGEYVCAYKSISAAAKHIKGKSSHISYCCRGKLNSCYGLIWRYSNDTLGHIALNKKAKEIEQYDLTGNYITKYSSITAAAKQFNCKAPNISRVLRGERNKFRNFTFKYKDIV